ncbi:hypothetical protein [Emticicia soli]|uniref:CdiI immunity protein domain-containing protein n=1 Tax=Emticicia soli TaxID=2027878 RepID=A0ABW5J7E3_9BACT
MGVKIYIEQSIRNSYLIGENSELNELWSENEEDYEEWRGGVEVLIKILER